MSYRKYDTPYLKQNPEQSISRTLKMQNLLQQYDRENVFLGQQVKQLLRINNLLSRNQSQQMIGSRSSVQPRKEKNGTKGTHVKRYEYFSSIDDDSYNSGLKLRETNLTEIKKRKQRCETEVGKIDEKAKKVKFTCHPYIEKSDVRIRKDKSTQKAKEEKDEDMNSPLKRHNPLIPNSATTVKGSYRREEDSPLRKSNLKKKRQGALTLVSKSLSKQKDKSEKQKSPSKQNYPQKLSNKQEQKDKDLEKSNISRKSSVSRKSGIQVYSKSPPKLNQDKIDLPMTRRVVSSLVDASPLRKTMEPFEQIRKQENSRFIEMTPIKKEPEQELLANIKTQNPKKYSVSAVQTDITAILIKQPLSNFQKQSVMNPFSTGQAPQAYPKTEQKQKQYPRYSSSSNIVDRSQSQSRHRICPSVQICNLANNNQIPRKRSNQSAVREKSVNKEGKKKFINLLTSKLLAQGKNLPLRRAEFSNR